MLGCLPFSMDLQYTKYQKNKKTSFFSTLIFDQNSPSHVFVILFVIVSISIEKIILIILPNWSVFGGQHMKTMCQRPKKLLRKVQRSMIFMYVFHFLLLKIYILFISCSLSMDKLVTPVFAFLSFSFSILFSPFLSHSSSSFFIFFSSSFLHFSPPNISQNTTFSNNNSITNHH